MINLVLHDVLIEECSKNAFAKTSITLLMLFLPFFIMIVILGGENSFLSIMWLFIHSWFRNTCCLHYIVYVLWNTQNDSINRGGEALLWSESFYWMSSVLCFEARSVVVTVSSACLVLGTHMHCIHNASMFFSLSCFRSEWKICLSASKTVECVPFSKCGETPQQVCYYLRDTERHIMDLKTQVTQ